ncbi:MAG: polyphosphate polymerase domain-containing protein [Prevotella sp.]|nr:polyphosphate polymerase domain-containing protein [Prevotella sp.]
MKDLIAAFRPITLEEMSGVKLMNRIDTKFITTLPLLQRLLAMAQDDYQLQEIAGERNMLYHTTYFDTPDCNMFCVHQHGSANRQKIRFRTYVSSDLQFLEIKTKNNRGRTKKKRIQVTDMDLEDAQKCEFVGQHLRYDITSLSPALTNSFRRLTLVNKAHTERLTIDTELQFHNERSQQDRAMGDLVIIELKRDGLCYSPVLSMLRELRIQPHGFSKYCMGSAFTNPGLRINRFKPKLRDVDRLLATDRDIF